MPSEEDDAVSTYPTICATQARSLLRRAVPISVDGSNDLGMSASAAAVRICEQATSDAPSKCLADTQHNRALSTKLRVQLCQRATSNSPQLCVRSLRKFVHVRRMGIDDAVMICRQTESPGPAECAAELFRATAFVTGKIAAQLCHATKTLEPARCFVDSPTFFDDELKVLLCNQAESSAPASCAAYMISRFTNQPSMKVSLCQGATSAAPAACAIEAPFGMDETSVVELCRSAESIAPARCAQGVPTSLRVPWHTVAQLVLEVLDQYGHPMTDSHYEARGTDAVHVNAAYTGSYDKQHEYIHRRQPALHGPSYAKIVNGSAVFSNLLFTGAGIFTLAFHAGQGVTEEVARVVVHPDRTAEALQTRCEKLFSRFQCSAQSPTSSKRDYQRTEMQMLLLPRELQLSAVPCGQYWMDNIGGLVFSGFSAPNHLLYALPRPLYELFTSMDMPRAEMSAWALLGLKEGESSRAVIRRAYHQRSLQWHPDKWHALAAALPPVWQQELVGIYALITQAYDQLTR
ncbi:hypothetical protein PC121_g684 [Phytophthora cactorum]|nr:hypothetical protein PC121_g684 [Phytophthora cactorum]